MTDPHARRGSSAVFGLFLTVICIVALALAG